jgi:hypothetical protein
MSVIWSATDGLSWQKAGTVPSGGQVRFTDGRNGVIVGGPLMREVWSTQDGGATWANIKILPPPSRRRRGCRVPFALVRSNSALERRLNVVLQSAGDVHDAFEQVAIGDVGEVNVNVDAEVGLGSGDLCPPLEAAGSHVELDLVSWERVAVRAPPRREVVRIGEGPECQLSGCVENA